MAYGTHISVHCITMINTMTKQHGEKRDYFDSQSIMKRNQVRNWPCRNAAYWLACSELVQPAILYNQEPPEERHPSPQWARPSHIIY